MDRVVRWRATGEEGFEHLVLRHGGGGVRADAVVIGGPPEEPFGLRYAIACDAAWRVREVRVEAVAGPAVGLRADGRGRWIDGEGRPLPALDGCVDVDLAATPFTNTLPIRRLGLRPGEARDLRVAYLPVPALEPLAVTQRYTRLAGGRRYRYEGHPAGFSADLEVDDEGLVLVYPGLFRRLR